MEEFRRSYCYKDVLPFAVMVAMESTNVGLNTVFKAATIKGLSHYVFVTYSFFIAALLLLPSPFLHRRTALPPLSIWIIGKLFLLSLIGSSSYLLGYRGISYSSPTLASAMSNLIPAFTFILAIIFRMEKLAWRSSISQAKIIGTVVSIAGALIVIFYKGPAIILFKQNSPPTFHSSHDSSQSNWAIGGFLLASEYILLSIRFILQAHIITEYPAELVVVFFYSLFAALISGAVGFVFERDASVWILRSTISLTAVLYSGLLGSLFFGLVLTWVLHHKGPVYIAMFKPLSIAIAAAMSAMFLGDTLHLGSVIGAIIISLGFYAVLWGKTTEEMCKDFGATDLESSSERSPLLRSVEDHNQNSNSKDSSKTCETCEIN